MLWKRSLRLEATDGHSREFLYSEAIYDHKDDSNDNDKNEQIILQQQTEASLDYYHTNNVKSFIPSVYL